LAASALVAATFSSFAQDATPVTGTPVAATPVAVAQAATPQAVTVTPRPAHIHVGDCTNLGEVILPLTDLVPAVSDPVGQANLATTAESSYTNVPLPLADILAASHAINVHLSPDQISTYIACGEIGGSVDANGAVIIGLRELNNSGFSGLRSCSLASTAFPRMSPSLSPRSSGQPAKRIPAVPARNDRHGLLPLPLANSGFARPDHATGAWTP
jgi:hypothetical protein